VPVLSSSSMSMSPADSTARPLVAMTLCLSMRSMPLMRWPKAAPDGRGNQAHEQRDQHGEVEQDRARLPGRRKAVPSESIERNSDQQKNDRKDQQ